MKGAPLPHLKCVACRVRLQSPRSAVGGVGELCPGCGELLESVRELSELVGFQAVRPAPDEGERESEAARWLDDGGRFLPGAVAQVLAVPPDRRSP